jgi:hypothetical protein
VRSYTLIPCTSRVLQSPRPPVEAVVIALTCSIGPASACQPHGPQALPLLAGKFTSCAGDFAQDDAPITPSGNPTSMPPFENQWTRILRQKAKPRVLESRVLSHPAKAFLRATVTMVLARRSAFAQPSLRVEIEHRPAESEFGDGLACAARSSYGRAAGGRPFGCRRD